MNVKQVELTFSESPYFQCPKKFYSMEAVNIFLWRENLDAIKKKESEGMLSYFKTDFVVIFEDDATYSGKYDIGSEFSDLLSHIRHFCEIYSGRVKPFYMPNDRWKDFKNEISEYNTFYSNILDKYLCIYE